LRKQSRVVFISDEIEAAFYALDDKDPLRKAIQRAVIALRENAFCGTQIPKKLFPKEYVRLYNIKNLWKINLPKGWRLLYTIAGNEVEIITAILEWRSHKEYEKLFKY